MSIDDESEFLLGQLSCLLGTAPETIKAFCRAEAMVADTNQPDTMQILHLVRIFRTLKNDQNRIKALCMLEFIADRCLESNT